MANCDICGKVISKEVFNSNKTAAGTGKNKGECNECTADLNDMLGRALQPSVLAVTYEKLLKYLESKHSGAPIENITVDRRYSPTYGWEYWVYFQMGGLARKDILSQHTFHTL